MAAMTTASAVFAAPAVAPRRAAKGLGASSSSAMRGEASAAYFEASARFGAASSSSRQQRLSVVAGNTNEAGLFSPLVIVVKGVWPGGQKEFNMFRGKAISLHSQVITEFCKSIGADGKVRQGLIRVAKANGGKLGFLA